MDFFLFAKVPKGLILSKKHSLDFYFCSRFSLAECHEQRELCPIFSEKHLDDFSIFKFIFAPASHWQNAMSSGSYARFSNFVQNTCVEFCSRFHTSMVEFS